MAPAVLEDHAGAGGDDLRSEGVEHALDHADQIAMLVGYHEARGVALRIAELMRLSLAPIECCAAPGGVRLVEQTVDG
jgi:hypothetical protein